MTRRLQVSRKSDGGDRSLKYAVKRNARTGTVGKRSVRRSSTERKVDDPNKRRVQSQPKPPDTEEDIQEGYNSKYNSGFDAGFAKGFEEGHRLAYEQQA